MARVQGPVEGVLRKAKRLVSRGWTRGDYYDEIGRRKCYCINGAIAVASGSQPGMGCQIAGAYGLMMDMLGESPIAFNDRQTSVRPVLAAFDKAIALAKERGL